MAEIIPAIMPESLDDLRGKMSEVKDFVSLVQIDVMDGKFVPPSTWPYNSSAHDFEAILSGEEDMPFLEELDFEVDMMITSQEEEAVRWMRAGVRRIIGHLEALSDPLDFVRKVKEAGVLSDSPFYTQIGIAIGVEANIEELVDLIPEIDFVQCMGISKIGYQGEKFNRQVLLNIEALKKVFPDLVVSVDGGVNLETAPDLVEAGADRLVVGSAIFEAEDKEAVISNLSSL